MFAVGHLALGYLTGKAIGKLLKVNPKVSLLFVASVIPDIDILISGIEHRGPTHSLIIYLLSFLPALLLYGKTAVPYFLALAQHAAVGDYITGGAQLLWPFTSHTYGIAMDITSPINLLLEWSVFLLSLVVIFKTNDVRLLFRHHRSNLLLSTPLVAVLLPAILRFPTYVPLELMIPHVIYLALFALSLLVDLKHVVVKSNE